MNQMKVENIVMRCPWVDSKTSRGQPTSLPTTKAGRQATSVIMYISSANVNIGLRLRGCASASRGLCWRRSGPLPRPATRGNCRLRVSRLASPTLSCVDPELLSALMIATDC